MNAFPPNDAASSEREVIVLFGVGSSLSADVQESLLRSGQSVRCVHNIDGPHYVSGDVLQVSEVDSTLLMCGFLAPMFTPGCRQRVVAAAHATGFQRAARWVDATVPQSPSSDVGPGVFIGAGCVIGACSTFGEFVLINRSASIGHHARVQEFASIGPGAVLAGEVQIGVGAVVGARAVVLPRVTVGDNAVVAAGSVVTRDVPDHCLVAGNPAVVKKSDIAGYQNQSVRLDGTELSIAPARQ